jgi:hypothetical protein
MRAQDLLQWNRAIPFRPFRIVLNSGRTYEIRHPEMLKVGQTAMNIFSYSGEPADPYEHMEMVSIVLVERVEPFLTPVSSEPPK